MYVFNQEQHGLRTSNTEFFQRAHEWVNSSIKIIKFPNPEFAVTFFSMLASLNLFATEF